jgi:L-amino acid N-acyltransferase YncA
MEPVIRLAEPHNPARDDAAQIQAIYGPIVRDTPISFELEVPTVDEMRGRIEKTLARFPWLVLDLDGRVAGYAYASTYRTRPAYQWSVEVSAYVHPSHRRCGVGRGLYTALIELLRAQGCYNAYAGIALPNPGSVALHESVGFKPLGVYRAVGYKLDAWHDVGWWSLTIQPHLDHPAPPQPIQALTGSGAWEAALAAGLSQLRLSAPNS